MYCRRNEMIAFLDDNFSMGIISLKLSDVLKSDETLDNIDMASVDLNDIEDVESDAEDAKVDQTKSV
jgi:hypothetical protein